MAFIDRLFDRTFSGLQRAMDLTWRRNDAIVSNIANAETPQYRAVDYNFAGELDRAFGQSNEPLALTSPGHMDLTANSSAHMVADLRGATKPDGNNVDIDVQMGQLAFNSGEYTAATDYYRKKLSMLKYVIRDGGR